jgi:hypothetical protein
MASQRNNKNEKAKAIYESNSLFVVRCVWRYLTILRTRARDDHVQPSRERLHCIHQPLTTVTCDSEFSTCDVGSR